MMRRRASGSPEADRSGEERPEEEMLGPTGRPVSYGPQNPQMLELEDEKKDVENEEPKKELEPLFTEEQVRQFEELHNRAPLLYGSPQRTQLGIEDEARSSGLALEDVQLERPKFLPAERPAAMPAGTPSVIYQQQMMQYFFMLQQENMQLKMEQELLKEKLREKEERKTSEVEVPNGEGGRKAKPEVEGFQTPESQQQGSRAAEDRVVKTENDLESERRRLYELTPMEQYDELQKVMDAAVGSVKKPPPGRDLRGPWESHQPSEGARQKERDVPKKEAGEKGTGGDARKNQGNALEPADDGRMQRQVDVLSKMMLHLLESQQGKDDGEKMEAVKPGVNKLQTLQEPTETAPIDYADWLTMIEPVMTDLSDSSHVWWRLVLDECSAWYSEYVKLRPLQRTSFEIEASEELKKTKWVRVERRAVSMLMDAIPTGVREELVATKSLSPVKVIAKLMTIYQPGGLHERTVILRQLEDPGEAGNAVTGVQSLRKWLRWLRRAQDVGLCLPDSTILLRGLTKLMKKLLNNNPELAFRTSLVRNTLQLDTIPNHQTVRTYSEHLLSELEQLVHLEKRSKVANAERATATTSQVKQLNAASSGSTEDKNVKKNVKECKFFHQEDGCRRGAACTWGHNVEPGEKRCYVCGSTKHFARECPRKDIQKDPKVQKVEKEAEAPNKTANKSPAPAEAPAVATKEAETTKEEVASVGGDSLRSVMEEASKMLKSMGVEEKPTKTREEMTKGRMLELQKELQQIQDGSWKPRINMMKTAMVARVKFGKKALLDTGATHALRSKRSDENLVEGKEYKKVRVNLAAGGSKTMWMTDGGTLVHEEPGMEPILPVGRLVRELGCSFEWKDDECFLFHPIRGQIAVEVEEGCPQITQAEAEKMVDELEGMMSLRSMKKVAYDDACWGAEWMAELVEKHPVLASIPSLVKDNLVEVPAEDLSLLKANRRTRRRWIEQGVTVHLYAGPEEGLTLKRAYLEKGGDGTRLIEIDVKRGAHHDMLRIGGMYSTLLKLAMLGAIDAVVGGPNCRTRSVLRHTPREGFPGPSRTAGYPWGLPDAPPDEQGKLLQDDALMLRMLTLYMVAQIARDAMVKERSKRCLKAKVGFLLEQPAAPEWCPECASWWRNRTWLLFKHYYQMEEVTFYQGDFGGEARKPTTCGTNLGFQPPDPLVHGGRSREQGPELDSSKLSRWAPGMMHEVARLLIEEVEGKEVRLKKLSWTAHVDNGHVPFRRDCVVCQRSAARQRPHRRHDDPEAHCLAVDICGPLKWGQDVDGEEKKYLLVGSYTWPVEGKDSDESLGMLDEETAEDDEMLPVLEDEEAEQREASASSSSPPKKEAQAEGLPSRPASKRKGEEEKPPEDAESAEEKTEEGKLEEKLKTKGMLKLMTCVPLASKHALDVLSGVQELVVKLRRYGYPVVRLHTDYETTFVNKHLKGWCLNRGIVRTSSTPEEHQQNGRAEAAIASIKGRVRRLLHSSGMETKWWPIAARHVVELERRRFEKIEDKLPRFGQKIVTRKRKWKRGDEFETTAQEVTYLTPIPEVSKGHAVMEEDGSFKVVSCLIQDCKEPQEEEKKLELEEVIQERDPMEARRRLRKKMSVASLRIPEEEFAESIKLFQAVLEQDEAMYNEDEEVIPAVMKGMIAIRKEMAALQEGRLEEEVLQTRVVSNQEVYQNKDEWVGAIRKEINNLVQKGAVKRLTKEEAAYYKREHADKLEVVPGKAVHTIKAPDGKKKCRLVVCGNHLQGGDKKETKEEHANYYAGGADTICLRLALSMAARYGWDIAGLDVVAAFLNAQLGDVHEKPQPREDPTRDRGRIVLMQPPRVLERLGLIEVGELWLVERALYGLRESPRLWSDHRDGTLHGMEIQQGGRTLKLLPSFAEENLWLIKDTSLRDEGGVQGLVLIYVDDMLVMSNPEITNMVVEKIQKTWEVTKPQWVTETEPVRFCGIEIYKNNEGDYFAGQQSFVKEVLKRHNCKEFAASPLKDNFEPEEELDRTREEIQLAQKLAGELLWLAGKTRPDLAYTTSRICSNATRSPKWCAGAAAHTMKYLNRTWGMGLYFRKKGGNVLEVATDASFAPGGGLSHGSVVASMGGTPVMWRSSKQPFPCLSTAETELVEAIEGVIVGDSLACIVEELEGRVDKQLVCDNMAAVALSTTRTGAWRTRHLKVRATHLKWRVEAGDWKMHHRRGTELVADMGTKLLGANKTKDLSKKMNLEWLPDVVAFSRAKEERIEKEEEKLAEEQDREPAVTVSKKVFAGDMEKVVKIATLMAVLQKVERVYAMDKSETEEGSEVLAAFGLLMMILGVVLYKLVERMWKIFHEKRDHEECQARALTRDSRALMRDSRGLTRDFRGFMRDRERHQLHVREEEEEISCEEGEQTTVKVATLRMRKAENKGSNEKRQEGGSSATRSDSHTTEKGTEERHDKKGAQTVPPMPAQGRSCGNPGGEGAQSARPGRRCGNPGGEGAQSAGPSGAVPTPGWRCGNPGGEGAQSAGPSGAKPNQGEGAQSARPDSAEKPNLVGPIITPNGRRFHRSSGCPTLAQSWKGRKPLCGECGDTYLVADVMMMDKNQLVHTKKKCPKVVGELIGYDACQRCA